MFLSNARQREVRPSPFSYASTLANLYRYVSLQFQYNPTSGLLSMLRSDWLSSSQAICYSPPVGCSDKRALFGGKKGLKSSFNQLKKFLFSIFLTNQLDFTKTIIPLALMASEFNSQIRPSASWAIDSEPIRARRIIVKYARFAPNCGQNHCLRMQKVLFWLSCVV